MAFDPMSYCRSGLRDTDEGLRTAGDRGTHHIRRIMNDVIYAFSSRADNVATSPVARKVVK